MATTPKENNALKNRLLSLDAFRGITMFLLIAEGTHLYNEFSSAVSKDSFLGTIAEQFHHHAWNGLRFWDLIQPFFMFIVGVAMAYSINKRTALGDSQMKLTKHIIKRCVILFLFGVILHCGYHNTLNFELWNVLTQLSFTILVAFFIFNLPVKLQFIISIALLVLTEVLYRYSGIEGYDQPFVKGQNFGSWMDIILMGKINGGGWVAINALPTAAHTIWGVIAGKYLQQNNSHNEVLKSFTIVGIAGLVIGYGMDLIGITPIIKRIATTSFVIATGGWALLVLGFLYWIIDVKKHQSWVLFFSIVGMNSIFIYMFGEVVSNLWFKDYMSIFTVGLMSKLGILSKETILVLNGFIVLAFQWYLCYWLYKKRIFFRI